jgi:hypothetical protein
VEVQQDAYAVSVETAEEVDHMRPGVEVNLGGGHSKGGVRAESGAESEVADGEAKRGALGNAGKIGEIGLIQGVGPVGLPFLTGGFDTDVINGPRFQYQI